MRRIFAGVLLSAVMTGAVWAQDQGVWVQVEALPTLGQAQERVRDYAGRFENVAGFALGSGWYAIALGPYTAEDAARLRSQLLTERTIPSDSFIADGGLFRQQFWPVGVGAANRPLPLPDTIAAPAGTDETAGQTAGAELAATAPEPPQEPGPPEPVPPEPALPEPALPEPVLPEPADETRAEAQASEAALSRPEREELQIALQWAGYYTAAIDGAFGPGTRGAMSAWQEARGHEVTGVLTTRQRAALLREYNAVLDGMDMAVVRDEATGIEMQMPLGAVAFAGYQPPFARFDARSDDLDVTVLLISQQGDQNRLFGLYEILQTLEIVPLDGPRSRSETGFVLEGIDERIHSYTEVRLSGGTIKGFSLIWPAGDEERRARVLGLMRDSFAPLDGVLDPAIAPPDADQAVDLISGLAVRQPRLSRSGFFVDAEGRVLTTVEAVEDCDYITLDSAHGATLRHIDPALGLAVLDPETALAPMAVAAFQTGVPRLQSEVAVAGYPYGGVLSRPALTFGQLADLRGLNGEEEVRRLTLPAQPGDIGGPVFDNGGAVLGMLLPQERDRGQILPAEVRYSVNAAAIIDSLAATGIEVRTTDTLAFVTPELLTRQAAGMTVLVNCW